MFSNIKSIQFDLDGTLIDSVEIYFQLVELALKKMQFPPVDRQIILEAAKGGGFEWNRVIPEKHMIDFESIMKQIRQVTAEEYPKLFREYVRVIPGVADKLCEFSKQGFKMAIVTATPAANMGEKLNILKSENLNRYFETIITTDDIENRKPAPDGLLLAAERIGVASDQSIYIGDMISDIQAGKAAGMKTIAVLSGFENRESLESCQPDQIITSVADFTIRK